MEGLTNEDEDTTVETKPKLFSIGIIILLEEIISLLNVGMLKIKSIKESNPKQGTSYQTTTKVVPLTMKSEDFCVKLEVSLEDKVYL
jgi:hypothetical protein